jgi:hypothetical protein
MSPITSFTASLGHDGNIDIFALALSPQVPEGHGVPVFRIRQKNAGGEWQPWANAGKPGSGAVGLRSITDIAGHGHDLDAAEGGATTKQGGDAAAAYGLALDEMDALDVINHALVRRGLLPPFTVASR